MSAKHDADGLRLFAADFQTTLLTHRRVPQGKAPNIGNASARTIGELQMTAIRHTWIHASIGLIALLIALVLGACATTSSNVPLVKVSKMQASSGCVLALSIINRYSFDIEGNYLDIGITSKSGVIIDRVQGRFDKYLFQAGHQKVLHLPTRTACNQIVSLKVYTIAFEMPSGASFPGFDRHILDISGL